MSNIKYYLGLSVVLCCATSSVAEDTKLFNGQNLDGWTFVPDEEDVQFNLEDAWQVQRGVLFCTGRVDGVLVYDKESYGDFGLTMDWRWPPSIAGTSALFLYLGDEKDDFGQRQSAEVSLFRDHAGDIYHRGFRGQIANRESDSFIFRRAYRWSPEKEMGEWNRLKIVSRDGTVTVFVNGRAVNQVADFPGSADGQIGLQSRRSPIFFRNIVLTKPLQPKHAEDEQLAKQKTGAFLAAKRKQEAAQQAAAAAEQAAENAKQQAFRSQAVEVAPESKFTADARALPFPPDTRELEFDATFGDIEFKSNSSLTALAAFFRREMAKRSWQENPDEASIDGDSIELEFGHGDASVSINLSTWSDHRRVRLDCEELNFDGTTDPAGLAALGIPQPRSALFLQKNFPLHDNVRDLEYDSDSLNFKLPMNFLEAYDHFCKLVREKGYRESRKPYVSDDRRYTEFQRGPIELSVNVYEDPVGSRVILGYEDERPEQKVASLPDNGVVTMAGPRTDDKPSEMPESEPAELVDVSENRGSVQVKNGNDTYVFKHVAAFRNADRPDVTHLVFSNQPIPFQRLQKMNATQEDFTFGDLFEFRSPNYLTLSVSWEHMGFSFSVPGVGIGMGLDDPIEDLVLEGGRATGSIKMNPDEILSRPFSFVAKINAAIITPTTKLGQAPRDPIGYTSASPVADERVPMPEDAEDVSRSGSNYRKTYRGRTKLTMSGATEFYRDQLADRGWESVADGTSDDAKATLSFRSEIGHLDVSLTEDDGGTKIEIVARETSKAKQDGVLPERGKARLIMVNGHPGRVSFSIGKTNYPMKSRQGYDQISDAYNYTVPPGTYRVSIRIPGQAEETERMKLDVGTTWAIIALPTGGYMPLHLY